MSRLIRCASLALLCAFAAGCVLRREHAPNPGRLEHLGSYSLKITTDSAAAQRAFDRGLTLAYSFAHHAAEQEFRAALAADEHCALAWWGIALVNGPHINNPVVAPENAATAWDALTKARELSEHGSPLEQALIKALAARYANPQPADHSALDAAYADAMREVWRSHPESPDAATLFAEALMDVHPWDYWANGRPEPWTPEIIEAQESALRLSPNHPGANHYYVHVMEASPDPAKALVSADRLRRLVPDASHMVHMPAHIYSRIGRWEQAAAANRAAMKTDALYRKAYPRPGFYSVYMAHNAHFLTWVYMMQGRNAAALATARFMIKKLPPDFVKKSPALVDGYTAIVPETLMRFGRWTEILQEPEPPASLPLSRALWRFTRAVALTALDRHEEAQAERAEFARACAAVPPDRTMGNNAASNLLTIAALVLDGEMAAKQGDFAPAAAKLREAAAIEDRLTYDEPPDWIQPVRHTLGAVLLRAGKPVEADAVYREDLRRNPENGWSLMGLRDALRKQGMALEAKETEARFKKAWERADISPPYTCFCQAGR